MQAVKSACRVSSVAAAGRTTVLTSHCIPWSTTSLRLPASSARRAMSGNGRTSAASNPVNYQSGMYYSSQPAPQQPPPSNADQALPATPPPPPQQQYTSGQSFRPSPFASQPPYQQQFMQAPPPNASRNYATGNYPQPPLQQEQYLSGYSAPPPAAPPAYPAAPAPAAAAPAEPVRLERVNPGRRFINSVTLIGRVSSTVDKKARSFRAVMSVPFATKQGHQNFLLEGWDAEAALLEGAMGAEVLVEGRLAADKETGAAKVVIYRVKLVDESLPPTEPAGGRSGAASRAAAGGERAGSSAPASPRGPAVDPREVYRVHYETRTQTLQALSDYFKRQPRTLRETLLAHAFETTSPLRFRPLAEEAGLGGPSSLTLGDFMALVADYRRDAAALQAGAQPGAAPPPLPTTKNGMLRVRPIRDWALGKPEDDPNHFIVKTFEAQAGLEKLYEVLQLSVVADATQGTWSYEVEFGGQQ